MKNRGFTLIELIGTIVILALILLIVTPVITRSIKQGVDDSDDQVKESIVLAAKNWASDHKDQLPVNDVPLFVFVNDLQSAGYLDDDVKLPSGKSLGSCVKITKMSDESASKKTYEYEYSKDCN